MNNFVTVKELSAWLRLSKSKIYSLVYGKQIPFVKIGAKILFDKEKITNWIEEQSQTND
jgi:hypothetical protein